MIMYYISITVAILSTVLYHVSQKATPRGANPAIALMITYAVAVGLTAGILTFIPARSGIRAELRQLNAASILLAVSIVGLELGFLLAYRSGWNLGMAAVVANVAASLILVPIALIAFKDELSWINLAGILLCLIGLVMLNSKH